MPEALYWGAQRRRDDFRFDLAIFAPCLPSAVRVCRERCAMDLFALADRAAFFTLRRAALRCF